MNDTPMHQSDSEREQLLTDFANRLMKLHTLPGGADLPPGVDDVGDLSIDGLRWFIRVMDDRLAVARLRSVVPPPSGGGGSRPAIAAVDATPDAGVAFSSPAAAPQTVTAWQVTAYYEGRFDPLRSSGEVS